MNTTLYSTPSCGGCTATHASLDRKGIDHDTVDVTTDPDALAFILDLGYQQAPVVVVRDRDGNVVDHWSNYRPDRINALAKALEPVPC